MCTSSVLLGNMEQPVASMACLCARLKRVATCQVFQSGVLAPLHVRQFSSLLFLFLRRPVCRPARCRSARCCRRWSRCRACCPLPPRLCQRSFSFPDTRTPTLLSPNTATSAACVPLTLIPNHRGSLVLWPKLKKPPEPAEAPASEAAAVDTRLTGHSLSHNGPRCLHFAQFWVVGGRTRVRVFRFEWVYTT
jgi:hypothetical protein